MTVTRFIDTHCHLTWESFEDDLHEVFARARVAGVDRVLIPATTLDITEEALAIAAEFEGVRVAAGVHPHDVANWSAAQLSRLRRLLDEPVVAAVGEIGLDYHYDFAPRDVQQTALRQQLALARERGLPVVLHNRESDDDLVSIVEELQDGTLRGQFHCFSSDVRMAERVLSLGFHISFTGNVTFKNVRLDEVIRSVPDDRLLLETDAPFMTPVPHRGTRNEPCRVPLIASYLADARGCSVEHLAAVTTANAERLFGFATGGSVESRSIRS